MFGLEVLAGKALFFDSNFFVYKCKLSLRSRWLVVHIYLAASQLGKLLRLATSTSVNNCYLLEESPKEM